MVRSKTSVVLALTIWLLPMQASGQAPAPELMLTKALHQSPYQFDRVLRAIALPGGRIGIFDDVATSIVVSDSALRTFASIGRIGEGPGEYSAPMQIYEVDDGGIYIQDRIGPKLLRYSLDGRSSGIVEFPNAASCAVAARRYLFTTRAIDSSGHLYVLDDPARIHPNGRVTVADSAAIVRWVSPCRRDTLAFVPNPHGSDAEVSPNGRVMARIGASSPPFAPRWVWAVSRDGAVATIDPATYRIRVRTASGQVRTVHGIQGERIAVSEAHKREWLEAADNAPVLVVGRSQAGPPSARMQSNVGGTPEPDRWPTHLPPFLEGAASFDLEGRLWVRRTGAASAPLRYDVFDTTLRQVAVVRLDALGKRIVGFGDGRVFVATRGPDDVERLEVFSDPLP